MFDAIALWVIVIQGFFVIFYEYEVWKIHKDRSAERAKWREDKRKQALKKEIPNVGEKLPNL